MARAAILGLVLSGGGARAAYQVGALRALAELEGGPFQIVAGLSAGAINGVAVALGVNDLRDAVDQLASTWRALTPDRVYRTDARSLLGLGARWIKDLATGGLFGEPQSNHLLDMTPLRALLRERLPIARLSRLVGGRLRGVAVTATSYETGVAISFYQGAPDIAPWTRSSRMGRPEVLTLDHVMASAAIPIFFPPVAIGGSFFGDGCVRMSAPLSPAVHLGADRIVAIGVRYVRAPGEVAAFDYVRSRATPTLSEIGGVLLNAMLLDALEADVERLERINGTLSALTDEQRGRLAQPLRRIPLLVLRPSRDLGRLAAHQYRRFPRVLRHLLRGIGADSERGWNLLSYLAFDPIYVETLMDLGYHDTLACRGEIERFLSIDAPPPA